MFIFTGDWELKYQFKAFEGFQSRQGYYTSKSSEKPSDGTVNLVIRDELNDETDPSFEQINAINYIIENPQIIQNTLLNAVHKEYENLKEAYGYDDDEIEEFFPKINDLNDYKNVFGIGNVFILTESKDGFAYVGFECGCTWDDEHGLGIFTHKNRVISFGAADEAFSSWEALKDNGTYEQKIKEYQDLNSGKTKLPKPKIYEPHPKYGKLKPSQADANRMYENNLIERGYNQEFVDLVEAGKIDININKGLSMSFLERATQFNNETIASYIISKKPKTLKYAIHNAVGHCNYGIIELLLDNGVDINEQNQWKQTPLSIVNNSINWMKEKRDEKLSRYEELANWLKSKGAKI